MKEWNNGFPEIDSIINNIFNKGKTTTESYYTEEELVSRLKDRDESAYQWLYDNYSKSIFVVIRHVIPEQELAQDVLQEVFVKVWKNIHEFDLHQYGKLYSWMISIARNLSIERQLAKPNKAFTFTFVDHNIPIHINKEEIISANNSFKHVFTSLSSNDANMIDLAYFKGFTQDEIARIMLVPVGVIKDRMHDAIQLLRETALKRINESKSVIYGSLMPTLGGKRENDLTLVEKMTIIRAGITKANLQELMQKISLNYDQLSQLFGVTKSLFINKNSSERFDVSISEKIIGLADLYSYGYEVFESKEDFDKWIFKPNLALGNQAPYKLIDNQFGREEVRNLIGRIDYGVYS